MLKFYNFNLVKIGFKWPESSMQYMSLSKAITLINTALLIISPLSGGPLHKVWAALFNGQGIPLT